MQDSYQPVFAEKERVMFVFAHPDDAEIYAGGTIARLVADGKKLQLVKMTTGNKGSRQEEIKEKQLVKTRAREDTQALQVLGLDPSDSINLDLGDGQVGASLETVEKLVAVIRKFKPEIVVTHHPEKVLIRDLEGFYYVNHRDHRNTGVSVVDAAYPYSRDRLFFPEHIRGGLSSHSVTEFLFVDAWGEMDTIGIDIDKYVSTRTQAIACHQSQFTQERAQDLTDFFAAEIDGRRFEQFRYVRAD